MGMDVYGRKNKAAYFRASVWGWRPLHLLISEANQRHRLKISAELLKQMSFNAGAGLESQADCDRLAAALDALLTEYGDLITLDIEPTGIEGEVQQKLIEAGYEVMGGTSYRISKEHAKEFISFLRVCGGFRVW